MNSILRKFLFSDNGRIEHEASLWNAIFSMLNAAQSVIFMFFIARICGDRLAGVFSFAFSIAYLMIMIGNYGVRNYHATDVLGRFGFKQYVYHRILTCVVMILSSVIYVVVKGFDDEKAVMIILCSLLKMVESIEDVIHGEYQRDGRLDVASKTGAIRYILGVVVFIAVLMISRDVILAFVLMNIVSIAAFTLLLIYTYRDISIRKDNGEKWYRLFLICFPLFASSFFNIYICNASKYALEKYSNDVIQAHYGMIFMPVFVINLLCGCIYRPHLVELADYWNEGNVGAISGFIKKQMLLLLIISIGACVVGYFIGVTVLSLFYGTDLSSYRTQFVILLVGGAMTATVDFMNNIITIIRKQKILGWLYGAVSLLALIITGFFVKSYGISGASVTYTAVIFVQASLMVIYVVYQLKNNSCKE